MGEDKISDQNLSIDSKITLNNDAKMPRLGLGVYQIPPGKSTEQAVTWALHAGYRHIDTAKYYRNEQSVGKAIRASKIPRKDVWVTTKLWLTDQIGTEKAFETSLSKLGLDYTDLYLVHFPVPGLVKRTWKTMEKLYEGGKCKAIGVSNHNVAQMKDIMSVANVPIMVNQVRCSPFHFDREIYDFCQKEGIAFEAYSPLTQGKQLGNAFVQQIANHYGKTPAQILIRWALQKNMIVIPKSAHQERIVENADVYDFELSPRDMKVLDGLSE